MAKVKKINSDLKELSIGAKPVASTVENSSETDTVELQNVAIIDEVNESPEEGLYLKAGIDPYADINGEDINRGTIEVVSKIESSNLYEVQAHDLNVHPELSQQGVQFKDEIEYGSKWVFKYTTASKEDSFREAWPRDIGQEKRGITFKEQ